jgi:hypothetical protein
VTIMSLPSTSTCVEYVAVADFRKLTQWLVGDLEWHNVRVKFPDNRPPGLEHKMMIHRRVQTV